jgi:lipopolysaccharide export system protein LptA
VVSQGQNVMRGDRLVVDLTSGISRVDAGKSHGPVRMLIQQQPQQQQGSSSPSAPRLGPPRPFSSN